MRTWIQSLVPPKKERQRRALHIDKTVNLPRIRNTYLVEEPPKGMKQAPTELKREADSSRVKAIAECLNNLLPMIGRTLKTEDQ
jgi:hypothetical protein